jgi:hypothetical protein
MIELIELVSGIARDWISGQQKLQIAKQEREQAAVETQTRQIQDEKNANSAWEIAALADSDKWLRRFSFAIFFFPIIWAVFDPNAVARYFNIGLATIPPWYLQTCMTITGVVWGVSSLKNSAPALLSGIKTAVKAWKNPDDSN